MSWSSAVRCRSVLQLVLPWSIHLVHCNTVLYCTVLYCAVLQLVLPCSIHLVHCSDVQIVTSARDIHCHVLHHAVACLSSLHAFFLYIDFLANSLWTTNNRKEWGMRQIATQVKLGSQAIQGPPLQHGSVPLLHLALVTGSRAKQTVECRLTLATGPDNADTRGTVNRSQELWRRPATGWMPVGAKTNSKNSLIFDLFNALSQWQ